MKIVTYIVIALLIASLAGGAYLYLYMYQPAAGELAKFRAGQPEFERARTELKKFQEKERAASGWIGQTAQVLKNGLAAEIAAGTAEVAVAGDQLVVNIAESVLYTPRSVTFAKNSQQAQANLAALLKEIKDKEILVGNTAQSAPAQGRGRRRVPAKDGRTLAAGRSHELVKALIRNGVPEESLVTAAYASKLPERGFKLKGDRTIIVIRAYAPVAAAAAPAAAPAAATPKTKAVPPTSAPVTTATQQPKPIPLSPAPQPKTR